MVQHLWVNVRSESRLWSQIAHQTESIKTAILISEWKLKPISLANSSQTRIFYNVYSGETLHFYHLTAPFVKILYSLGGLLTNAVKRPSQKAHF